MGLRNGELDPIRGLHVEKTRLLRGQGAEGLMGVAAEGGRGGVAEEGGPQGFGGRHEDFAALQQGLQLEVLRSVVSGGFFLRKNVAMWPNVAVFRSTG